MTSTGSFRRRRLGRELRRLREERKMRGEAVAQALDIASSTLSRIENALVEIRPNNVRVLLDYYRVEGEEREALLTLAREARQQGWWHVYGDVLPSWFEVYIDLETEASTLDVYDNDLVNGLLQTEDYARAMLTASRPEDAPEEIDRHVALRMRRQNRIISGALRLRTIVDECALHRAYGGAEVMADQIRRLIEVADLRNVSLQILPSVSAPATAGRFSVIEFGPNDPTVVYLENEIGALYLEKPVQVRHYTHLYDRLRAAALSPEASVAHLAQLSKE